MEFLKPSIIVVSGDIVEGAEGENAEQAVKQQYEEAAEFLTRLADYFLQKDKNRLIIVPGNHNMFRGMSEASMVPYKLLADDNPKVLRKNSLIRWSWKDLKFYKIAQENLYAKRFDLFVEFYNTFYEGIRAISGDPETFSDVVDLDSTSKYDKTGISIENVKTIYPIVVITDTAFSANGVNAVVTKEFKRSILPTCAFMHDFLIRTPIVIHIDTIMNIAKQVSDGHWRFEEMLDGYLHSIEQDEMAIASTFDGFVVDEYIHKEKFDKNGVLYIYGDDLKLILS